MINCLNAGSHYFTGEVYKIDIHKNRVICKNPDLFPLDIGKILYICDENNILVSTIKITGYNNEMVETVILSGDLNSILIKMPVYSNKDQFINVKPKKELEFEKDYDYCKWNIQYVYKIGGKLYTLPGKMIFPKIITVVFYKAYELAKLPVEDISDFYFRIKYGIIKNMVYPISTIKMKNGRKRRLDNINISFRNIKIPEKSYRVQDDRSTGKIISLKKSHIRAIRLINRDKVIVSKKSFPRKEGFKRVKFPGRTLIIQENSFGEDIYFIISGKVKLFKTVEGEEIELGTIGTNSFFGEMGMLFRQKHTVSVETMEKSEILIGNRDVFFDMIKNDPDRAMHVIITMAKRLKAAEEILSKTEGQVNSYKLINILPNIENIR
jgi:CRP-like cAMP-binding protein